MNKKRASKKPAGTYIPPLTKMGSIISPRDRNLLAPGVFGYAVETNGKVYIPDIMAEKEGSGAVGKFLDSLAPKCVIANVISSRLAGMLQRRGWKPIWEEIPAEQGGGKCDVWMHPSIGEKA